LSSTWAISEQLTWFIDMDIKDDFRLGINHDVRSPFAAVINSELSWKSVGKHLYSLKLWVKNIADRDVITRGFGSFPNDPRDGYSSFGPYFQYGQPRQVGITFKYEWE
jgi:outer membrane receptor protein involved in Fe transport